MSRVLGNVMGLAVLVLFAMILVAALLVLLGGLVMAAQIVWSAVL